MFKRKCPKCKEKIQKSHRFCPFCGQNFGSEYDSEDYGFLGKDDSDDSFESMFTNLPLNKIFQGAMKMLQKQMKELNQPESNQQRQPYSNVDLQFFVNGKRISPNKMQIQRKKPGPQKIPIPVLSKEKADKFAKLPRKEPKTTMKRLSGKLVYEISMPGVKDISDILINQLENSIEIKALSKTKVYSKTININLPIISYKLDNQNLILELQAK